MIKRRKYVQRADESQVVRWLLPVFLSGRHRRLCRTPLRRRTSAIEERLKIRDSRREELLCLPQFLSDSSLSGVVVVALPVGFSLQSYFRNRGRPTVVCPQKREPVTVELDNKFAFKTALRGEEHERLQSCSRWPEKGANQSVSGKSRAPFAEAEALRVASHAP